jgi:hypothetical protein
MAVVDNPGEIALSWRMKIGRWNRDASPGDIHDNKALNEIFEALTNYIL